ncbi:ComEC/Rec2 family competence protein [Leifsonia poae]|uniref:Membrane protein n=1 Tax=Leifsonia poae TaxID=110933 RepID=A0A9W6M1P0_9MICO|nr:membrane protein [Leifsonia poae]
MTVDLRLAVPAVTMWGTAAMVVGAPQTAPVAAAVTWTLVGVGTAITVWARLRVAAGGRANRDGAVRTGRGVTVIWTAGVLSLVAAALVLSVIAREQPRRAPEPLVDAAAGSAAVTLEVRADRTPQRISGGFDGRPRWMWKGTASSVTARGERYAVESPVTVIGSMDAGDARTIVFGSVSRVEGSVRANDPGDTTAFLVSARSPPVVLADAAPWLRWTDVLRNGFSAAAAATPGDGGSLLPGLAIGDVSAVGLELDEAMKVSALSHLTAVSGANCALVTGIVFLLCAAAGLGRGTRVLISLAMLLAFVVLVTPGASVVRAATMAVIVLVALARGRPAQGVPVLALAVIVLLAHDPWLARDYGFALSALATAGLLVLAGPLARVLARWMPRSLAAVVSIPLAAQLACQPVLILLTPTLPLYGVAANLLAEPAAPIGTLVGLVSCLVLPVAPVLGQALVWVAWLPSAWIAAVAQTTASLPGSSLPWVDGPLGVVLCAGALAAVAILALGRRSGRPSHGVVGAQPDEGAGRRRTRGIAMSVASAVLIGGIGVYAGALGGATLGSALATPDDWQIAVCDVGQGDALLLRDDGRTAMIDVGRTAGPTAACLDRLGVEQLDLLVLTHYDADHIGGLESVIGRATAAVVGATSDAADDTTVGRLESTGTTVSRGEAGMHGTLGGLSWRVVWPPAASAAPPPTGNAGSVVITAEGHGLTSLFLGDLGEREQDELLASGTVGAVDVVKVAHHGSADQSAAMYAELGAALGLLSVGAANGYGHPTARAFEILGAAGTSWARTDRQGLVLVSPGSAEGAVSLWTERSDASGARIDDSGPPYAGGERGGTWRHEAAAGRTRARGVRRPPSRSSPGTRFGPHRSSSSPAPRAFSRIVRSVRCATRSRRRTRASKSAISPPTTTPPASS